MKICVIINSRSGQTALMSREHLVDTIRTRFHAHQISAEVKLVSGNRITLTAREAIAAGRDAIVACGGDGTISSVANALVGSSVPLGVLPLGTFNHFAKDLGLPLLLTDAIDLIARGHTVSIDVGEVNNHIFINNSSIGLYPYVVRERDVQRQQLGRRKWLAMFSAFVYILRRFPLMHVKLIVNGHAINLNTPFVFVGNNTYEMDLLTLGSRSSLTSGLLSLYVTNRTGRFGLFKLLMLAMLGRLDQAEDFFASNAVEIWIETRKRKLRVASDGEVYRMKPPLHYRIRPGALTVIAGAQPL